MDFELETDVPLAPRTTLGVGGPARYLATCPDEPSVRAAFAWARERRIPTFVLGDGSNLVVADDGFDGLVVCVRTAGVAVEDLGDGRARARAGAGVPWDELVETTTGEGLVGIECLSGIPGRAGAAPIQNIGAYGQEVGPAVETVWILDRDTLEARPIPGADCAFGYRTSVFKTAAGSRAVVLGVDLVLRRGAPAPPRHGDLARALDVGRGGDVPPVAEVRRAVLAVRAAKSMLLVPDDENRRSAGSFFVNPVVPNDRADAVETAARRHGTTRPMPRYPAGPGELKLSAAWLIEQAGIPRGFRLGRAGVSTRHTLALVNRGGATAAEIVALAACVRAAVRERFGVVLQPEPVFLGFGRDEAELLG